MNLFGVEAKLDPIHMGVSAAGIHIVIYDKKAAIKDGL